MRLGTCILCGTEFVGGKRGRMADKCHPCRATTAAAKSTARSRAKREQAGRFPSTPEQRSERARRSAEARWAGVSPEARKSSASLAAQARWAGHVAQPKKPRMTPATHPTGGRCVNCGGPLGKLLPSARYCGKSDCRLAANARRMRGYLHERRARQRGVASERFVAADVFVRDGWLCGVCGGVVDPSTSHPHPESASLDHIVPLARGGAHAADNAQCAHLVCNIRKGARLTT